MKTFRHLSAMLISVIATISFPIQNADAQAYVVNSIAYQPYAYTGGRPVIIPADDYYSQSVPIGFNFTFFGNTYSQLAVGSNGNLSFKSIDAGSYDPWQVSDTIPNLNVPLNNIYAVYRDIDLTYGGNINYQLLGNAPNRVFLVSYDSIHLYGSHGSTAPCQDTSLSVFQVALYEGCNMIEVYIHHSPGCSGWNRGMGIVGIIDSTGTVAFAAPGRNDTAWTADDEAWRFSLTGSNLCSRGNGGPDQNLCLDHIATMQATGMGTWSAAGNNPAVVSITNPSSPNSTVSGFSAIGSYVLAWTTAIDTSLITVNVVACSDSVWPGDADFNGLVDNNDLLPVGLAYDSTGPLRAVQGIVWQPYSAAVWSNSFNNYAPPVNFKHADCNGDGIVDSSDVDAIHQNWSMLHTKNNRPDPYRSGLPTLHAVPSAEELHPGDSLTVDFVLGDSSISIPAFYGVAFTYNYDPALVDSAYTSMAYSNSWIGAADKISFVKILNTTGEIKTAVTRIDHGARSGYGPIGSAKFKIRPDLSIQQLSSIINSGYISGIYSVDPVGQTVALNASTDTTTIVSSPSGIREISTANITVKPNPAREKVMISADNIIKEISVTNVMGQEIASVKAVNDRSASINVSNYTDGLYVVQVKTEGGRGVAKFVVEK